MSGKCIQVVNTQGRWKHIPVLVGNKAPKRNDLIEFEELECYDTEVSYADKPVSPKKEGNKDQSKKQVSPKISKQSKSASKSVKITDLSNGTETPVEHKTLKRKRKKRNKSTKTKKQKLSIEEINTDAENQDLSLEENFNFKMSAWNNLHIPTEVLKALYDMGFYTPLPIQKKVMQAAIVEKRDILGAAETGSGKTLAFGIPLLHHLLEEAKLKVPTGEDVSFQSSADSPNDDYNDDDLDEVLQAAKGKYLLALILTPTRELAIQVTKHLKNAAKYTGLSIISVVGGMAPQKQIRLLKKDPDIVVATPGRLWELIADDDIPYLSNMHLLRYLVIDEADRMLEQGHFEDLTKLLDVINLKEATKNRQTFVFSATLMTTHHAPNRTKRLSGYQTQTKEVKLSKLIKKIGIQSKPLMVDLTTKKVVAENLSEGKIICEYTNKDFYLYYFLKSFPGRTLVFANSIDCIFRLSALFQLLGCHPLHIHAKMQQRQRLKHLERFQSQTNALMFASDVAARGLDIPNVRHVIHYQTPRTMETYVHRSGRCARSGNQGNALMLISPQELNLYKKLCRNLNKEEGIADFLIDDSYMGAVRKRVLLAREVDKMLHRQKKVDVSNTWFSKNADAIGVTLDSELMSDNPNQDKSLLNQHRKHLKALLATPLFPSGFSGKFLTKHGKLTLPEIDQNANKTFNNGKKQRKLKSS